MGELELLNRLLDNFLDLVGSAVALGVDEAQDIHEHFNAAPEGLLQHDAFLDLALIEGDGIVQDWLERLNRARLGEIVENRAVIDCSDRGLDVGVPSQEDPHRVWADPLCDI